MPPAYPACKMPSVALQPRENRMSNNLGILDRTLRIASGMLLVALAAPGTIESWGYLGVLGLLTGVIGACPVYSMLGLDTRWHGR
jgi:hypothetical protein